MNDSVTIALMWLITIAVFALLVLAPVACMLVIVYVIKRLVRDR